MQLFLHTYLILLNAEGCAVGELDVIECGLEVFAFVAAEVAAFVVERHKGHVILTVLAAHDAEGGVLEHFLPAFFDVAEGAVGRLGLDAETVLVCNNRVKNQFILVAVYVYPF